MQIQTSNIVIGPFAWQKSRLIGMIESQNNLGQRQDLSQNSDIAIK